MTEWEIVGVLVVLVGLISAVITPIIKLNTTVTRLTTVVSALVNNVDGLTSKNGEAHSRIWDKMEAHDDTLRDHETRIRLVEHDKEST